MECPACGEKLNELTDYITGDLEGYVCYSCQRVLDKEGVTIEMKLVTSYDCCGKGQDDAGQ